MSENVKYMKRALGLAARGLGRTGTNPVVGAVIVKNGKVLGQGYHKKQGGPHAEIEALKGLSKRQMRDAIMYVTLEPCVHENKRTPPCTSTLAGSGLKKIFVAIRDPNPLVDGKGIMALRKSGIKVETGMLEEEARRINEYYLKSIRTSLPFVTLKMAQSLDGRIATSSGDSRWISNGEARKYVHNLRGAHCAVMTTSATVLADDPHLGVRDAKGVDPMRIIIDRKARLGGGERVFRDGNFILITEQNVKGAKIRKFSNGADNHFSYPRETALKTIFMDLYRKGIGSIMVEAGGRFAAELVKAGLADKYLFFIAPVIIGGDGKPSVSDLGIKKLVMSRKLCKVEFKIFGDNLLVSGY